MTPSPRIEAFDSHVHAGPAEPGDALAPPPAEELWRRLSSAGITRAVIFAPNRTDGYRAANEEVLRIAGSATERWVPFLRMRGARPHPRGRRAKVLAALGVAGGADEYSTAELSQLLTKGKFQGVKLNLALDGMPSAAALDLVASERVPCVLHTGEGIDLREVESEFLRRGVPTVLAHMGTYPLRRRQAAECFSLLDRYPCAWLDTAMVMFEGVLAEACRRFPDRVLFGSDAPAVHPEAGRAPLDALPLDDAVRTGVMRGNLERLLSLRAPQRAEGR